MALTRRSSRVSHRLFLSSSALVLAVLAGPTACNSEPEVAGSGSEGGACERDDDCTGEQVCNSILGRCGTPCSTHDDCGGAEFCSSLGRCEQECASCGNTCTLTEDCPVGQFCTMGSCQQECEPGTADTAACGNSRTCSSDGKCIQDDIDIGMGGSGTGGSGGEGNEDCIDVEVDFNPQIPNVVLLIDQSGSMNAAGDFGDAVQDAIDANEYEPWDCGDTEDWRWNVVRNVLFHPDNGVVKPLEDRVRFGMALYSSDNGTLRDSACPLLTEVDLGFGTHEAMLAEFECDDIEEDTPTRESLTAVAEQLAAMDLEGPKVIVLATDGEPDNCHCPDWGEQDNSDDNPPDDCYDDDDANLVMRGGQEMIPSHAEQFDVTMEAQRIFEELNITIEVINVSNPGNASLAAHLDDVAERGGATSGASIDGFSPGALTDAFNTIIDGVRSCAIDLDGEISPGKESTGKVTLDGEALILDDPHGWIVNSPTQIELQGDACDAIKSGDHDLDISFPCGSFVPVIPK